MTFNLRDFPAEVLEPLGLTALHPDALVEDLWAAAPAAMVAVIQAQAADLRNPTQTFADVLATLERCGLPRFVALARATIP